MVKNKPLLRSTPIKEKGFCEINSKDVGRSGRKEHHAEQYYDNQKWKSHNRRIL